MRPNNEKQPHKSARKTKIECFVLAPGHNPGSPLRAALMDVSPPASYGRPGRFPRPAPVPDALSPPQYQRLRSASSRRKQDISRGISHPGCWGPLHLKGEGGAATGTHPLRVAQVRLWVDRASANFQNPQDLEQAGTQPPLCILSCTYGVNTAPRQQKGDKRQDKKEKAKKKNCL